MKKISVLAGVRASFAVAYRLTTSPATSLKSSSAKVYLPLEDLTPRCESRLTVLSGPALTE